MSDRTILPDTNTFVNYLAILDSLRLAILRYCRTWIPFDSRHSLLRRGLKPSLAPHSAEWVPAPAFRIQDAKHNVLRFRHYRFALLPDLDSNQDTRLQRAMSYH